MLIFLMYMFAVLGVSLLLAAAVLQFKLSASPPGKKRLDPAARSFQPNSPIRFITPDQSHMIALDQDGQKLEVGTYSPGKPEETTATLYAYDRILGSEIVENALTLTKISKTSRITSSTTWHSSGTERKDALAGTPEGLEEEINELTLKIYLDSKDTPVLSIPFLPGFTPARKCDLQYAQAFSEAHHVHEIIRGIVSA